MIIKVHRVVASRIRSISSFISFLTFKLCTMFTTARGAAILGLDGYEPFTALYADAFDWRGFNAQVLPLVALAI